MYKSAADALHGLLSGAEKESASTPRKLRMPEKPMTLRNGIDYFFVEVTFANGDQYGIPAYGAEAHELREKADLLMGRCESQLAPMIA